MRKIINVILICIIIFCGYKICYKFYDYSRAKSTYNDLREIHTEYEKDSSRNIEEEMEKINEDYKFWLKIDNTNIDYPVVQGKDNLYYLKHDFNKKESDSGAIFLDYRNNFDEDKNCIIYGHNMKNKTMFENLNKFKDKNFWDQNKYINIIKDNKVYKYEIFSAYVTDPKDSYIISNFQTDEEYEKYLNSIREKSLFKRDINLDSKDKIITLSTCSYEFEDARMVIHGKLLEEK